MRSLVFALCFILCPFSSSAEISGQAVVKDGDTIVISKIEIRLEGIDAPERGQGCFDANEEKYLCGSKASFALADFIGKKHVTCKPNGTDRYKRVLATCFVDGEDMQAYMVREGFALAFVRYSQAYVKEEVLAKAEKKGMWAGTFVAPWVFRACHKRDKNLDKCSASP